MTAAQSPLLLNTALTQADRAAMAPHPEMLAIDGRSLAQLLASGARYGALIHFYDLADMPNGSWEPFFASDPAVAAAVRGALDLPEIEAELRQLLADARRALDSDSHHAHVERAQRVVMRLLVIAGSGDHPGVDTLDAYLHAMVDQQRHPLYAPIADLHRHRQNRRDQRQWRARDLDLLDDLAAQALTALEATAAQALDTVDAELQRRGHAPQAALWNAFVQLYAQARAAMNHFPARMLEFYHRDVLRQTHCDAIPAQAFITFQLNKDAEGASVPKGTRFLAGADANGDPIIYIARQSLAVVPASITKISVHRKASDGHETTDVLSGTVTSMAQPFPAFGSDVAGQNGGLTLQTAGLGFVIASPMLMLEGGDRTITITLASAPQPPEAPARAPGLLRAGGMRRAMVTGAPEPPSGLLSNAIAPAAMLELPVAGTAVAEDGPATVYGGRTATAALHSATTDEQTGLWFALSYSTAGGWMQVQDFAFTTSERNAAGEQTLVFAFTLPPDAPPLAALGSKPVPGSAKPDLPPDSFPNLGDEPTVVAQLLPHRAGPAGSATEGAPVLRSNYAVLEKIKVQTVTIDVTVNGLPPSKLASSGGPIDPGQNFATFGIAPAKGAMLKLSATEIFAKLPSTLSLDIKWARLPVNRTGFAGWYADYIVDGEGQPLIKPFDNRSFTVSLAPAQPGLWKNAVGENPYLFATEPVDPESSPPSPAPAPPNPAPAAKLAQHSQLTLTPVPDVSRRKLLYFNPAANQLTVTLETPDDAFGDTIYARNLMAASKANCPPPPAVADPKAAAPVQAALKAAITANATATDKAYLRSVHPSIVAAVAALNAHALTGLQTGIGTSQADKSTLAGAQASLNDAVTPDPPKQGWFVRLISLLLPQSLAGRLLGRLLTTAETEIAARLHAWTESWHEPLAKPGASAGLAQGKSLVDAAKHLAETWASAAEQPTAIARAKTEAALQTGLYAVSSGEKPIMLPNPPWLPMCESVRISYTAADSYPAAATPGTPPPAAATAARPAETDGAPATATGFAHLDAFGQVTPAMPTVRHHEPAETSLLQDMHGEAALYIDLSQPVDAITLLFVVEAGPDGWSTDESQIFWQKHTEQGWVTVDLMQDSTGGLRNTGIVALQIGTDEHDHADTASRLRAVLQQGSVNSAYIRMICPNALSLEWAPTAGAETLGVPMPAGTITKSEQPIAGIASISQPVAGFGGVPPATGQAFHLWMAERLRHKGRAIAGDDYARMILAAMPSLWQLAVVPACRGPDGARAPGHVWLVAVAGPTMLNITDPTVPDVDPVTLSEIEALVAPAMSPFVQLTVSNAPWTRIAVHATIMFNDLDTPAAWMARLNDELKRWLSPWPDPLLPPRPSRYWTRQAVAEFVRNRPFVIEVVHLELHYDPPHMGHRWQYFTSANLHHLKTKVAKGTQFHPAGEVVE